MGEEEKKPDTSLYDSFYSNMDDEENYVVGSTYNLFLDDVRSPAGAFIHTSNPYYLDRTWIVVRSYDAFVKCIKDIGMPEIVSFDHDLADAHYDPTTWTERFKYHEKTGKDCANWLVDYCLDNGILFPKWYVHSQNPVGSKSITSLILNYLKHCEGK